MKYIDWLNEWLDNFVLPVTKERTYNKYKKQIDNHIKLALGNY